MELAVESGSHSPLRPCRAKEKQRHELHLLRGSNKKPLGFCLGSKHGGNTKNEGGEEMKLIQIT